MYEHHTLDEIYLVCTAISVKIVTKIWNIINIKLPHARFRTNDPDRNPFRDKSDDRLQYLTKVATTYKTMDISPRGQRMHSLTSDTSNALHRTLTGIVALIKLKLDIGFSYVLPGKYKDRIEGEFGIYRQNSGENYCISMYQVFNNLKLQQIKLYHQLQMSEKLYVTTPDDCCSSLKDNDEDLEILDSCFESSSHQSDLEISTLYYIPGYVAFKENCAVNVEEIQGNDSEFLNKVSRGRLGHPPAELYDLSQYLFAFFKTLEKKCCCKLFLEAYETIYEAIQFNFDDILSILRRFNNCFFKAFSRDLNDKLKRAKDEKKIKQRRKQPLVVLHVIILY